VKLFYLMGLVLLSGCSVVNKVHPNLATQMVQKYPDLQAICDHAGGCENVDITCVKYDDRGNSHLKNLVWWTIEAGYVRGDGWTDRNKPDNHAAIEYAIASYWEGVKYFQSEASRRSGEETVYPNQSPCDKDCWK